MHAGRGKDRLLKCRGQQLFSFRDGERNWIVLKRLCRFVVDVLSRFPVRFIHSRVNGMHLYSFL